MNELVEKYIKEKEAEAKEKLEKEKANKLYALGLFEKEYAPDGEWSYKFTEYDSETKKYYKKVPIQISDKEYEEVLKYSETSVEETTKENVISILLKVVAWIIFIGGFIAGIAMGTVEVERGLYYSYTETVFSFAVAFIYWSVAFISGISFLGFAEIIKLLDEIKRK